jgi:hypothetical protein
MRSATSRSTASASCCPTRRSGSCRRPTRRGSSTSTAESCGPSYELALWLAARDALRARRLYLAGSYRYGGPAAWMMPRKQWAAERVELAAVFDRPLDGRVRLEQLQGDQERLVRALQHGP